MSTAVESTGASAIEIERDIQIDASPEDTFEAILLKLGPENEGLAGAPMPMVLESHPGGRWYRDLGNDNGHLWGHVQAIKRPALIEITGPLFMSYAVVSNLQYRLMANDEGTLLRFKHSAYGLIDSDHREGLSAGWSALLGRVKAAAERT